MIRKPGSDKGPGFSMFGAYVCELIEGYVMLRVLCFSNLMFWFSRVV